MRGVCYEDNARVCQCVSTPSMGRTAWGSVLQLGVGLTELGGALGPLVVQLRSRHTTDVLHAAVQGAVLVIGGRWLRAQHLAGVRSGHAGLQLRAEVSRQPLH